MLSSLVVSVARYWTLLHYGLKSSEYKYCYFYSDAVLTILLYLALITLYLRVFDEMNVEKYVRLAAVVLLAGTALFSYAVVQQSSNRMLTGFFFELSQKVKEKKRRKEKWMPVGFKLRKVRRRKMRSGKNEKKMKKRVERKV